MNIGLLCSGGLGSIILNILFEQGHKITAVFTDKGSDKIIDKCNANNLPVFIGNPRKGTGALFLSEFKVDILLSVNYLFLIKNDIFSQAEIAINFHGSLLPKYRGRTPHVWSIINNESKTGITAHIIDEGCDTGDIIYQKEISIDLEDTGASILDKYNSAYPGIVAKVLDMIAKNQIVGVLQNNEIATYFGKRTPSDGQISWNWQKDRIRNWVRAQSYPYPGAFTYYHDQKFTIDKIEIIDTGYSDDMENGLILSVKPLIVKTPNGAILIKEFRENFIIEKGQKFI